MRTTLEGESNHNIAESISICSYTWHTKEKKGSQSQLEQLSRRSLAVILIPNSCDTAPHFFIAKSTGTLHALQGLLGEASPLSDAESHPLFAPPPRHYATHAAGQTAAVKWLGIIGFAACIRHSHILCRLPSLLLNTVGLIGCAAMVHQLQPYPS